MRGSEGAARERTDVVEGASVSELARSLSRLVSGSSLDQELAELGAAAARATESDAAVVRVEDEEGGLVARAVHAESAAVAAELERSRVAAGEVPPEEAELAVNGRLSGTAGGTSTNLPLTAPAISRAAGLVGADVVHVFPAFLEGRPVATLELLRVGEPLSSTQLSLARLIAAHVGTAVRLERALRRADTDSLRRRLALELAGEALAASGEEAAAAEHVARRAAEAAGASAALTWSIDEGAPPSLVGAHGLDAPVPDDAAEAVLRAAEERRADVVVRRSGETRLAVATLPLGEPPVGALQLHFVGGPPPADTVDELWTFAGRAAVALRRSRRAERAAAALESSRTVIAVVGQAIAHLSLAHTLETAVDRISELTGSGRVAVYLREGEVLEAATARGLAGRHTEVAARLLELALGPFRSRGFLVVEDAQRDPRLAALREVVDETGIRRALVVPLVVHEEVIGALALFEARPRRHAEGEESLLIALSSQLAVAVQNARLHERAKELGEVLEETLESERQGARQLRALYEISRSFAESLSLEATLEAIAKTMVELFSLDAAAIRMPDPRGRTLEPRAIHVADERLRGAAQLVLAREQPMTAPLARRLLGGAEPVILTREAARASEAHVLLEPFLEKGSTAAVLPMTTAGEVLGTITLLSLDPSRPLGRDTVTAAMGVVPHAALAIENARLSEQQRDLADEMQRSLLPQAPPEVPGVEVGHVYHSSARVDVGGDLYDFLAMSDGSLAVVLGDVAGKGVQAAADMAMMKFVFRTLARTHARPSAFLARANDVVLEEIGIAKFVTMVYALVDPAERTVAYASAGHPPPRLVQSDGSVSALVASGLALGIEGGQEYAEERIALVPGSSVVLYTDGVVEARRGDELYGEERLDEALRANRNLGAQELAEAVLADCRAFVGGEPPDDCALVVLRLAQ